jgi:glycosyltransferase involved in cell wall biosynthesis
MSALQHRSNHVLLFSSFAHLGRGGQESLFQLVSRLDRDHFRPSVVVPSDGSLAHGLRTCGIDVHVLNLPKVTPACLGQVAAGLRRLSALIDQEGVDILHTDGPRNTFYAGLTGRLKQKPVVWHVRASARDSYDRLLYRMCSKLILVADSLRDRFAFATGAFKLVTIYNGVDLARFKPGPTVALSSSPAGTAAEVVIATVGRIEEQKGLLPLLHACRRLKESARPFKVRVGGAITDRRYFQRCQEFCRAEGLSDRVEYLGHVHPIEELLHTTDIFVLPSVGAEAFPRAVIEAMACGKPVVVTDAGGTREAVVNGQHGFVVPARDPMALAGKLRVLMEDEGLRIRMGRAGRIRAEECFGVEKNLEQTMRVYAEVLRSC